jgi:hypothetical protein
MAALAFVGDAQPWQRSLRWTRPAPDRRVVALGIALALLLTAIEVRLFDVAMRREVARAGHAPPDRVLHVDLIEEERPVEPTALATAPVLPLPKSVPRRRRTRVMPHAPSRAPEAVPSERTPRLFGLDGHILLPDEHAHDNASNAFSSHIPHGDPFARANPVPYEATRFDKYFPDVRESLGGEIVRKTTLVYSWRTPWGTVWECKSSLLLLGMGGCTWGPAPTLTIEELKALRADPPPSPPQAADPAPPATNDTPQYGEP